MIVLYSNTEHDLKLDLGSEHVCLYVPGLFRQDLSGVIVQNCGFHVVPFCKWDLNLSACMGNPKIDVALPSLIKFAASDPVIVPV